MITETVLSRQALIAGRWTELKKTFDVVSPSSGQVLAQVADCGVEEARLAADAAVKAFAVWRAKTADERAKVLKRWNDLMLQNETELARLMSSEMGRPITETRG